MGSLQVNFSVYDRRFGRVFPPYCHRVLQLLVILLDELGEETDSGVGGGGKGAQHGRY